MNTEIKELQSFLETYKGSKKYIQVKKQSFWPAIEGMINKYPDTFSTSRKLWHLTNNVDHSPKCKMCDNEATWRGNYCRYQIYCSDKCSRSDKEKNSRMAEKRKEYWETDIGKLKRKEHGVSSITGVLIKSNLFSNDYLQSLNVEQIKELYSEFTKSNWNKTTLITFIKSKGYDADTLTVEEMKKIWGNFFGEKIKSRTKEEKAETWKKRERTNLKKYGSRGVLGNPETQQKYQNTLVERYDVTHILQNSEYYMKAYNRRCKKKDYTMPSGKVISVQGYEPIALDELVSIYPEHDIEVSTENQLSIKYFYEQDRVFFPDIRIKSENKLIEVKSTYTWKKDLKKNLAKKKACLSDGFLCEFWVYDGKGNKVIY